MNILFNYIKNFNINEFLWSCAGVNKSILRLYPQEYAKYAGSGGTILFTALMAMISGGYAMFFVFNSVIVSILFAILWSCLIFNLDRFIVNSMHTDGKDTLSWKKIRAALPRIIMTIFLGIVISTPLEMKVFNDRIESQLLKDNIERINDAKSKSSDYITLNQLQQEVNQLTNERKQISESLIKAQKELKDEAEGNALSKVAGHGTIYKDKQIYVNQCKQSLVEWDNLHKQHLTEIQNRIKEVNSHIELFEGKIDNLKEDGFSARYEAFSNLKESNMSLNIVSIMITMLFIIIEVTPTFFKLIMISGPYEEHLQMEQFKVTSYIQKQKDDINTELKISEIENKEKLDLYTESIIERKKTNNKELPLYGNNNKSNKDDQKIIKLEPLEVPYNVKSNTSIITKKKSKKILGSSINKQGQLVLNFSSKSN